LDENAIKSGKKKYKECYVWSYNFKTHSESIRMSEEKIHFIDKHVIDISSVQLKGRILDIGGGGEGIIGQFKGNTVVAIDKLKSELKEAADGEYLKIIMDAEDLKFLDATFDTITAFYMFMYVPVERREQIFKEIFRVLKRGGEFIVWDMVIVENKGCEKKFYGARVEVIMGDSKIETGYATHWDKVQDLEYFLRLGEKVKFQVIEKNVRNEQIFIKFQKPK
jgi:ubiquinone/menaquinone biosynthesis C-methylase UbiE